MNISKLSIFAGIAAVALSSCVKDTLYDAKGNIEVSTVWNNISADAAMPSEYTMHLQWITPDVRVDGGDRTATVSGDKYSFNGIAIGDYRLSVYNTPEGVTLNGTRAAVAKAADGGIVAYPGNKLAQGRDAAKRIIADNPELADELEAKIAAAMDAADARPDAAARRAAKQAADAAAEAKPAAEAADMDTTVPAAADDDDEFSIEEDL